MNGRTVLVVDDDDDNRELLVELLETEGYAASAVANGVEAIAQLEAGLDPDLILTDLMMPVMSGWDLCAALKAQPAWRAVPVIVLCGVPPAERGTLQVSDAFEKPTDVTKLLARVAELCQP